MAEEQDEVYDSIATNKWSRNGFGQPTKSGGKFTREETEIVRRSVEEYCALKQISTSRLCSECDHKAELKGAWMEIAKRLPHRTVQSVYRHGLRQLHPFQRGPWTEAECKMLAELVQRMGKKWSAIQSKLNRSADSCRDKYREMSNDYVKGRWKEGETEILKRLIREHLRADPNADIKELGKMVEQEGIVIPWSSISKRMGKRSRLSCFKKWQKLTGLYSPSDQNKVVLTGGTEGSASAPAPAPVAAAAPAEASAQPMPPPPVNPPPPAPAVRAPAANNAETRHAPTAGAAAAQAQARAAAVAAMNSYQVENQADAELYVLSEIANSGASRDSEVDWTGIRVANAQERWKQLVGQYQDENPHETCHQAPIYQLAHMMLERKQQAKTAAETVEALDLPTLRTKD